MPSINYLNPPPHPFWDFVAGIEDHPFFAAHRQPDQPAQAEQPQAAAEPSEKTRGKEPAAEDPPEVDPATVNPNEGRNFPFRGRGRFGHAFEEGKEPKDPKEPKEGCRRGGPGCHGRGGPRGPPPFMFGPRGPWWAGPREGPGPGPGPHGPGPHAHGPHPRGPHAHHHGPPRGCGRGGSPPHHFRGGPGARGFDLGQFLSNLGERLGVDLAGAAENLGVDRFTAPRTNAEVDFEPRADIFDSADAYTIHLSLPGAKKSDVGVDWDGENSVLHIAGVVHRPGVDEKMLTELAVNGRKRENGVFEKAIRLGTKRDPASIDVAAISAKMTDGVLVVRVPKVEVEHKKRDVPVSGSGSPSPAREAEKDLLFDADEEMYDAQPTPAQAANHNTQQPTHKEKEAEARDDRSETVGQEEQLPRYEAEDSVHDDNDSDWEKYGSEEEGEYVKINVD